MSRITALRVWTTCRRPLRDSRKPSQSCAFDPPSRPTSLSSPAGGLLHLIRAVVASIFLAYAARTPHEGHKMPTQQGGHDHMQMAGMGQMNEAGMLLMEQASGTSMNPRSWAMPM